MLHLEEDIRSIKMSPINDYDDLIIEERALIYRYSEGGYQDLNEQLTKHHSKNKSNYARLLNKCVGKLKNYEGSLFPFHS